MSSRSETARLPKIPGRRKVTPSLGPHPEKSNFRTLNKRENSQKGRISKSHDRKKSPRKRKGEREGTVRSVDYPSLYEASKGSARSKREGQMETKGGPKWVPWKPIPSSNDITVKPSSEPPRLRPKNVPRISRGQGGSEKGKEDLLLE